MNKRKTTYTDINASARVKDTFGTIFGSMVESGKFKALSPTAKLLYMYCRIQSQSIDGKTCLYKHGQEYDIQYNHNIDFVFPARHLEKYGLDRRNADKYFKELIAAGFIRKKEKNNLRFKVNVYSFSDNWKDSS